MTLKGWKASETVNAWLACHTNFILQCNMRATRYSPSHERPK
jgi:hypothetical protein